MRKQLFAVLGAMLIAGCANSPDGAESDGGKISLFNGKDTAGWKMVNPKTADSWKVVSKVSLDPKDDKQLVSEAGEGVLLQNGGAKHGSDMYTEREFADCKLHVEFMIPKGSNSGVYMMGKYEIQILDTFGKPDSELKFGDSGGIYKTSIPKTNAMKAAGEWQSYDIVFRASRFDKDGKKTENAKFISVKFNGKLIHENVDAPKTTGGEVDPAEKATGPVMLQGNHGIVAFRNITITPMDIK